MAATVPTTEPTEFQAGNTFAFTKDLADFPSTLWILSYALRKKEGQSAIDLSATPNGTGYSVNVAPAITALWVAGDYVMAGYVTEIASPFSRFEIYNGRLQVSADIAASTAIDPRGIYEQMRDKLQSMILGSDMDGIGGIIRDIFRYGYNGTNTEVVSMKDAFEALDWLNNKVNEEKNPGKQQRVLTRFRAPR